MRRRANLSSLVRDLLLAALLVGTLSAMLLPAFTRVRASARQAVCLGNVLLIAQAIRLYLVDNDLMFPPSERAPEALAYLETYPGGGPRARRWGLGTAGCKDPPRMNPYLQWPVILDSYVPTRGVWRCPSARIERGAWFINGHGGWLEHLKSHNGDWGLGRDLCPDASWPAGWGGEVTDSILQHRMAVPYPGRGREASPGVFQQSIGVNRPPPGRADSRCIQDPSWYVTCADGGASVDEFGTGTLAYPDLCCLECAGPGFREADWENCPWSRECGGVAAMKSSPILRERYARHYGGVNIGFLDGHARWLPSERVIEEAPSGGDPMRGHLRGIAPWGPTKDAPWSQVEGIDPLY